MHRMQPLFCTALAPSTHMGHTMSRLVLPSAFMAASWNVAIP